MARSLSSAGYFLGAGMTPPFRGINASTRPGAVQLIRTHPIKHDRTREHGALANPGGRPRRTNAA
ncbi:hypothetical protein HC251_01125 [Iamia sp. SCSIO 61187]|uniref:hypothetical protein n=1 Tax=Iamia sp. SCSIO 61187 TaxID=2722752 RepID=UPI001C633BC4|nr:hypothetical protein [Iamia sp. SCSIO 61187]QYG91173.1 hypothetical protein HC251_01125 [Iamia sp. SCSIO 61187]